MSRHSHCPRQDQGAVRLRVSPCTSSPAAKQQRQLPPLFAQAFHNSALMLQNPALVARAPACLRDGGAIGAVGARWRRRTSTAPRWLTGGFLSLVQRSRARDGSPPCTKRQELSFLQLQGKECAAGSSRLAAAEQGCMGRLVLDRAEMVSGWEKENGIGRGLLASSGFDPE